MSKQKKVRLALRNKEMQKGISNHQIYDATRRRVLTKFGDKEFFLEVEEAKGIKKFVGLMFKRRDTDNLIFYFSRNESVAIHSFFVWFKFLAVWLDEQNNVVDLTVVRPFRFYVLPKKKARKLIELPFNDDNKKLIDFFVGKTKI